MKNKYLLIAALLVTTLSFISAMRPQPVWAGFPGANGRIVFHTNRDVDFEIYTMKADGSEPLNLSNNAAVDQHPAWSSDGTQISFLSSRDGNNEIYIMNADGTDQTNLTNNSANDSAAAWSPDGTQIAFASNRDGNNEIYIMNADGSGQIRLTNNAASDTNPNWSPDGNQIVYQSATTIRTMNIDGTNNVLITSGNNPNWSPDGSKIVYNHTVSGDQEILIINADGTNITQVTNQIGSDAVASWSPDGNQIVFRSSRDGNDEIYRINVDGTNETRLTTNLFADTLPDWQPLTIPPTATNDPSATTTAGEAVTIDVLANDTDTYGSPDPASVTVTSAPANGTTSVNATTGAITYTPNAAFVGNDSFSYRVCSSESASLCDTALVTVTVTPLTPGLPATGIKSDSNNGVWLLAPLTALTALIALGVKRSLRTR